MTNRPQAMATALIAILLATGTGCRSKPPPPPPTPRAHFMSGEVRILDADGQPEGVAAGNILANEILSFLNAYYDAAFLDPKHFRAGARDLLNMFDQASQPNVAPNIEALALGDLAAKIARVRPTRQRAERLSLFLENDRTVSGAVVTAVFIGLGARKEKGAPQVKIEHRATFWLTRGPEGFKITTFEAQLKADSQVTVAK